MQDGQQQAEPTGQVVVDAEVLDGLRRQVADLEAAMARVTAHLGQAGPPDVGSATGAGDAGPPAVTTTEPPAATDLDAPTNRRQLLTKGVAAAAGAALAGTAAGIATASPAAAAPGTFDGNPAVTGTASPNTGTGVSGTTETGIGVDGRSTVVAVGAGTGTGVRGQAGFGTGVLGETLSTTGSNTGVEGRTSSSSGSSRGVFGRNLATTGTGEGIRGVSASPDGIGVHGESAGGSGVGIGVRGLANSQSGTGVNGRSLGSGGTGVKGQGSTGVWGECDLSEGFGVVGHSGEQHGLCVAVQGQAEGPYSVGVGGIGQGVEGTGVSGYGSRVGMEVSSTTTQLSFNRAGGILPVPPLTAGIERQRGEVVFDDDHDLWLCVANGTPGTWRRLSGPATAGAFVPLPAPVRAYDSRPPFPPATGPKTKLTPNTARTVDCTLNGTTVPTTATGVLVSLVATGSSAAGHVAIYRDTIPYPNTSNANFAAGQTVAVTTFSALTAGKVAVYSNVAIDVVLDVLGYYQ